MPLATVPQGNEESRGGQHWGLGGVGESEERQKEGERYFNGETAPKASLSVR